MAAHTGKLLNSIRCRDKYLIPIRSAPEFIDEFEEMELRKDDIFIVTFPKGGTHWMLEIVHLIIGYGENINEENRRGVIENSNVKLPLPHIKAAAGPTLRRLGDVPSPRVLATHSPCLILPRQLKEKQCKVIYVYRNLKDTVVSFYNFKRKIAEMESGEPVPHSPQLFSAFFDAVVSGNYEYGSWFEHLRHYNQYRGNENYFFVSYETMKEDLEKVVKDLALFLGHCFDDDDIRRVVRGTSMEAMRGTYEKQTSEDEKKEREVVDLNVYVNKGETKQWKNILTKEQNEKIDELLMKKMKDCELAFEYMPTTLMKQ